ncbi:hypothetical protein V5O48_006412 [Marasmius crinis-equi]|uniref:Uncharacterized protein n=1 Tax=Marasmius crinis-equi TaxID=585013 RepID=A0ABR3FKH1_9AGAR
MSSDSAFKLKEAGNDLFSRKQYRESSAKYIQAIATDDANAILIANRAACWLILGNRIAWQKAFDTLPSENLTDAEKTLREEIQGNIIAATRKLNALHPKNLPEQWWGTPSYPPVRACALAMVPELEKEGEHDSCAFYLSRAYLHLDKAGEMPKAYQPRPDGVDVVPSTVYHFSEAILRDAHTILVSGVDFADGMEDQGDASADLVIEEIPGRLSPEGWD